MESAALRGLPGADTPHCQDTGSFPRRPSLLFNSGFPGKVPPWSWWAVQWRQRKYPTWQRTLLQLPVNWTHEHALIRALGLGESSEQNQRKILLLQSECFYSGFEDVSGPGIDIRASFRFIYKKSGQTYKTQAPPPPPICIKEPDNLSPDIHFFEFCNSLVLNIFIKMQTQCIEESPCLRCNQLIFLAGILHQFHSD